MFVNREHCTCIIFVFLVHVRVGNWVSAQPQVSGGVGEPADVPPPQHLLSHQPPGPPPLRQPPHPPP